VAVTVFVRMKIRLLRNGFRGAGWRVALTILGVFAGVWFAFVGFGLFSLSGLFSVPTGYTIAVLGGAGLVVGWTVLPLVMFGVDETLDPTRFALLPIRLSVLVRGLYTAAFAGIPAIATLAASQGLVLGAAARGGAGAAVAAFAGTLLGVALCVAASRAVTTAMATALRTRRARDAAIGILALIGTGLGPLQIAGLSIVDRIGADRLYAAARIVAWTPLGAPYAIGPDVASGRWPAALAHAAIAVAAVALLLWWWAAALPGAMVGGTDNARPRSAAGRASGLVPAVVRTVAEPRFAALVSRELRYWWRDPRRRSSLVSLVMVAIALPVALSFLDQNQFPLPWLLVFAGSMTGTVLANQFGFDGSALAANLLAGIPGRTEMTARIAAVTAVVLPPLLAVTAGVGAFTGDARVATAIGTGLAAFGASAGLSTILSVLVPYALPESNNPFALSTGTGGLRGFVAFAPLIAGGGIATPLVFLAVPGPLALVVGLATGTALLAAGILIGGGLLDDRAPEVLAMVSPRR
jgi:ABC-2 type transport system permease protein